MAVEIRYHVIRDGEEVAVYLTKKEADEHDKMLDIAFALSEFIGLAPQIQLEERVLEELTIYLSQHRAEVIRILRAQKPSPVPKKEPPPASPPSEQTSDSKAQATPGKSKSKGSGKKK